MTEKVLIIAVPVQSTDAVPAGPAVINGILSARGYTSTVWDLNIDLFQAYSNQWDSIVNLFGIRAYNANDPNKISVKNVLRTVKQMVRRKLKEVNPDCVLLSIFSSQSLDFVIPLSTMIRELAPNAYVLAGGRGLDNTERITKETYADYYSKYLPVDCWYLGDAENNLINVLENKYQGVFVSPMVERQDLENLPSASWSGYDLSLYQGGVLENIRFPITGSKGCVRKCTFCDVEGSWPKYIYRKGQDIGKEMVEAYRNTGVYKFEFTDNLVNGSITNFRLMNQYIVDHVPAKTLDYRGYAICRPKNEFPRSDFKLAADAGATFFKIGIETGSDQVRHDLKKKFTNDDIAWFAENCYDHGIKQLWLMFVGYPTETEEDFQQSIELLKRHQHLAKNGMIEVFLSLPMMLTSGSAFMRKYSQEYGLSHNADDAWGDFFWTSKIYTKNTFDVRVSRWKRFVEAINTYGYSNESTRQAEKLVEIEGIEKIYSNLHKNGKKIIPISTNTMHINKSTHV